MRMPDLATTGSPMTLIRILATVGDAVTRGQTILEVETDKAVMNVESTVDGVLKSLAVEEGAEVVAGQVVAVFEVRQSGSAASIIQNVAPAPVLRASTATAVAKSPPAPVVATSDRVSFFARNRARREKAGASRWTRSLTLSVVERVVARRTQASKQTVPHFYLQTSVNAEGLVKRRAAAEASKPVWDAFFVIAAARALREHPRFGYRFDDDKLTPHGEGAIGVAVDLDGDLYTIAVDDPTGQDVEQVSDSIRAQVDRLKTGDPRGRQARPTSLTISNLGGSNVETFTAVVNTPEAAILAVGKIMPSAVVVDGQVVVQNRVNLTLSVDHRVAGGKAAAGFLGAIVRELESF
ncbi:Dihydrolipoyllysine-residue acetyltransferase component of pyruvate dehydrogenase complex [Paludisphaera borealis]|uniref:Dihydrolipoamide acetyltransferase component of pyruvate dehydrogenase complex n=2 Tax=Paludisphaera borealis TaxID=1387353 RepID=A0A1U7CKB1_9BACT|nr:Dihydrolipoyllysine-residue acetyltransferase component of pyruvate dehydrogenase complex [Paludisphaera borealis]